jgi:hypothetical protein
MSSVGLKLNSTIKFLDDMTEQVLGTINGINLCQTGPFIYATGNGAATAASSTNINRLLAPAAIGQANAQYAYQCGIVDVWSQNKGSALSAYAANATTTSTGAGGFRNWDLSSFANSRPFMVAFLGDGTSTAHYGVKLNGVTKQILPSAETANTILRYVQRVNVPLYSGVTAGSITASKWGDIVIVNACGITSTRTAMEVVIGTLPEGFRPSREQAMVFKNHNGSYYNAAAIMSSGMINIAGAIAATPISNAWGCGIFCLSDTNAVNPIWDKANMKINGVSKAMWAKNSDGKFSCKVGSMTPVSPVTLGSGASAFVYRVGNFVFGCCKMFRMGVAGQYNGVKIFTIPTGFRPAAAAYSTGFGSQYANTLTANMRLATNISTDGSVNVWAGTSNGTATTSCSICFYYYCNEAMPS